MEDPPHCSDEEVRADVPGLEKGDEELAELLLPLLLLGPVVLTLVLTRLLLVARHDDNLGRKKQLFSHEVRKYKKF